MQNAGRKTTVRVIMSASWNSRTRGELGVVIGTGRPSITSKTVGCMIGKALHAICQEASGTAVRDCQVHLPSSPHPASKLSLRLSRSGSSRCSEASSPLSFAGHGSTLQCIPFKNVGVTRVFGSSLSLGHQSGSQACQAAMPKICVETACKPGSSSIGSGSRYASSQLRHVLFALTSACGCSPVT